MVLQFRAAAGLLAGRSGVADVSGTPRRLPQALEADFQHQQLQQSRVVIRAAAALGLLLTLDRCLELWLRGSADPLLWVQLSLVLAGSVALVLLAWTRAFERHYRPWAEILIPMRSALAAAHLAQAAALGHIEMLMLAPLLIIGPFFFMRLRLLVSCLAGATTMLCFAVGAACARLPVTEVLHASVFLAFALLASAFVARRLECNARRVFVEGRAVSELAQRDGLTGLLNRRSLDVELERLWQQAAREGRRIAIVLADADHFKAYNDRHGHLAGDEALQRIAACLQGFARRPLDLLARYGGEEFAAVFYDVDVAAALALTEEMRATVGSGGLTRGVSSPGRISLSIGVAALMPDSGRSARGALQLADQALYGAKLNGRNCVVLLGDADYGSMVTGQFAVDVRLRAAAVGDGRA